jgi:hypothetical protein
MKYVRTRIQFLSMSMPDENVHVIVHTRVHCPYPTDHVRLIGC